LTNIGQSLARGGVRIERNNGYPILGGLSYHVIECFGIREGSPNPINLRGDGGLNELYLSRHVEVRRSREGGVNAEQTPRLLHTFANRNEEWNGGGMGNHDELISRL